MVKKEANKIGISFVLLGMLLAPRVSQWLHLFGHHHSERYCPNNTEHFHASERTCELKATFTLPYIPTEIFDTDRIIFQSGQREQLKPLLGYSLNQYTNIHLRGPPHLLFPQC